MFDVRKRKGEMYEAHKVIAWLWIQYPMLQIERIFGANKLVFAMTKYVIKTPKKLTICNVIKDFSVTVLA